MAEEEQNKHAESDKWLANSSEYSRGTNANMSDKNLLRYTVYKCKSRADMTEEERMKKREYDRVRRANMSEEKRRIKSEQSRKWLANLSEERRKKIAERAHERCVNMTKEQRQKKKEYIRKRRDNMTEEMRIKILETKRKWCAKRSEESRMKRTEYNRIRNINLTVEQRKKYAESRHKRRTNMTEEERKLEAEYHRKWRANWTEEQRNKYAESRRKWRSNMTEKEKRKLAEFNCKWLTSIAEEDKLKAAERKHDMTEEEHIKKALCQQKWYLDNVKQWHSTENQNPDILSQEQLANKPDYNPLKKLVEQMIKSNMNVETISGFSIYSLRGILKLIGSDCAYKKKKLNFKSAIHNLACEMDLCYLIKILKEWDGWEISNRIKFINYDSLFFYLKTSILNFKLYRQAVLTRELNKMLNFENVISVSCSFKQLQNLFYHSPQKFAKMNPKNVFGPNLSGREELLPKYIVIWPHVSTRITLPDISMTHQNDHFDEYTLMNMMNRSNTNTNKIFAVNQMTDVNNSEKYLKYNIAKFINQLKNALIERVSGYSATQNEAEIIMALMIFENDLAQCPDVIESHCKYNWSTVPYPYARYLGCSDDGDICTSMSDQKAVKKSKVNVRLQQIRYPNISFSLENYNVPYGIKCEESQFVFDDQFLNNLNKCLSYKCLLCNEDLGSSSPSVIISDHFSKYHGLEPDWECTHCLKSYTNNYLLNLNWRHDCTAYKNHRK